MSKAARSNQNNGPSFHPHRHRPRWVTASVCFVLGILLMVAFLDYSPEQSPWLSTNPTDRNLVGLFGASSTMLFLSWLGIATWLIPGFLFWMTYVALRDVRQLVAARIIAMVFCLVSGAGLAAMVGGYSGNYFPNDLGGQVGRWMYDGVLYKLMGGFGSAVVLGLVYALSLVFLLTSDIGAEFDRLFSSFHEWRAHRAECREQEASLRAGLRAAEEKRKIDASRAIAPNKLAAPVMPRKLEMPSRAPSRSPFSKPDEAAEPPAAAPSPVAQGGSAAAAEPVPEKPNLETKGARVAPPASVLARASEPLAGAIPPAGGGLVAIVKPEETRKAKTTALQSSEPNYQFPPLSLLKDQVLSVGDDSDTEHLRNMEDLVRILGEFGVTVSAGEIHVGPVITSYEVVPAPGVRVEKISSLDKNIALGMRAQSVRILAPIPGKAAVGIEIPNRTPTPVGMREILESEDWASAKAEIPIALGKDVSGKPLISDLAKMPHLLIAGATGSGKSVCINSIIASIVYRKSPKDLRLLMVDPKVVELKVFNSLPHMLIPVVTEPKKVPSALKWLLGEMEMRYQIFAKVGVRNIVGFNGRKRASSAASGSGDASAQPTLEGIETVATAAEL
ncbi:MAG: DNA translocase FtsK, partial [Verrucomicrobia bacterium]